MRGKLSGFTLPAADPESAEVAAQRSTFMFWAVTTYSRSAPGSTFAGMDERLSLYSMLAVLVLTDLVFILQIAHYR